MECYGGKAAAEEKSNVYHTLYLDVTESHLTKLSWFGFTRGTNKSSGESVLLALENTYGLVAFFNITYELFNLGRTSHF